MNNFQPPIKKPYPKHVFEDIARKAGDEIERNINASPIIIFTALLDAMVQSVQGLIDVQPPSGPLRPVVIYTVIVAPSGSRKSTADTLVFKPLYTWDGNAILKYRDAQAAYFVAFEVWDSTKIGLRRQIARVLERGEVADSLKEALATHLKAEPKRPRLLRLLRQNATERATMDALDGDGVSLSFISDEAHLLFRSETMQLLGLWNKIWDGAKLLTLDRADLDQVLVMNPRVSLNLMTQMSVLKAFMDKHGDLAKGSGYWARFLFGVVDQPVHAGMTPTNPTWVELDKFHARMNELLQQYIAKIESGDTTRKVVEFSPEATVRWLQLSQETAWLLQPGQYLNDISDFAAKAMDTLARIAAAFHYFEGHAGKISLDTLERAMTVLAWYADEYKLLFSPTNVVPQCQINAHTLARYLRVNFWHGLGSASFVAKNFVLHSGPVRPVSQLNDALSFLEHVGAIFIGVHPKTKQKFIHLNDNYFSLI